MANQFQKRHQRIQIHEPAQVILLQLIRVINDGSGIEEHLKGDFREMLGILEVHIRDPREHSRRPGENEEEEDREREKRKRKNNSLLLEHKTS